MPDHQSMPQPGEILGPLEIEITAERVHAYADAGGDHNPIHIDAAFAETSSFGGPIAHGMLLLAYLARVLTARFGRSWVETGSLEARFRNPAHVGSRVVVRGEVQGISAGPAGSVVTCALHCEDSAGQILVAATAKLTCV